jgi:uncharacterized protein
MEMEYDWDPVKAASNLKKHRITFQDASTVFDDPLRVEANVTKPEYGEVRYIAIGMMHDGRMTAVVYTDRESKRRIISARNVRKDEQQEYDNRKASARWQDRSGDA